MSLVVSPSLIKKNFMGFPPIGRINSLQSHKATSHFPVYQVFLLSIQGHPLPRPLLGAILSLSLLGSLPIAQLFRGVIWLAKTPHVGSTRPHTPPRCCGKTGYLLLRATMDVVTDGHARGMIPVSGSMLMLIVF
jgi:hypothetical protein